MLVTWSGDGLCYRSGLRSSTRPALNSACWLTRAGAPSVTLQVKINERRWTMDISILTAIILVGILLESFISERSQGRVDRERGLVDRLTRYEDLELG